MSEHADEHVVLRSGYIGVHSPDPEIAPMHPDDWDAMARAYRTIQEERHGRSSDDLRDVAKGRPAPRGNTFQ